MKRKLLLIVASLLVSGMMFAQDLHWSDETLGNVYDNNTHITGRCYLDDVLVSDRATVEVAAFVGDVFRGSKLLVNAWPNSDLGYFVWTNYFYTTTGEAVTFKAYDHESDILYDLCDVTLYTQDADHGSRQDPVLFHFTKTEQPTYGPDYPWEPSNDYDGQGMLVVAQIQINGVNVDRDTYEVGAFCGEECRADSYLPDQTMLDDFTDDELGYFAFLTVMGNDGDEINFYLYDLESDEMCPVKCYTTVTLANGGELGLDIYGDDIFVLNFVTEQTFEKEILAYTENGGYYLIASPIGEVDPDNVENMRTNTFDLYYFAQEGDGEGNEWINIKDGNTNLVTGKGYLYANSENVTLKFKGFPYDGDGNVSLRNDVGDNTTTTLGGWNLVGNPFADTAYITVPFYTMNSDGSKIVAGEGSKIAPMEGIFVDANEVGEVLNFSTSPAKNKSQIVLNVIRDRGTIIDRAIVRFGEEKTLVKFTLNENDTKLYIPQDDKDYAVVTCGEAGEIPVSFKADHNGSYTINVSAEELDVNYMHLIDNLTGTDVDLLQNPTYNFNAQTTDYASRFKLVFATGANNDDVFGFYSNGNWIINNDGDAILQVVDVTGRIMSNEEIHGSFSKRIEAAPGVYMLRLVKGNDVKVQKIVVK